MARRVETKSRGYFGPYGGRFAPETLMAPLEELTRAFERFRRDRRFLAEFSDLLRNYAGRPTPLSVAPRLTEAAGGARIASRGWCYGFTSSGFTSCPSFERRQPTSSGASSDIFIPSETINLQLKIGRA